VGNFALTGGVARAPPRRGRGEARDERELLLRTLCRWLEQDRAEDRRARRGVPSPTQPPSSACLDVAGRDGALLEAPVHEQLRGLAGLLVEIWAAEASLQKRLHELRNEGVWGGHERIH
jgi:hypothetical protein